MPDGFDLNAFLGEHDQEDETEASDLEIDETLVPEVEEEQEEESEEESDESVMDDVEKRLEIASFYQALLKNPLFNGSRNKGSGATVVEKEVRSFCRTRLEILVGLKQEVKVAPVVAISQFTQEQAETLIAIANQLLAKNRTTPIPASMPTVASAPMVNAVAGPKTAVSKPAANKTQVKPKAANKTPPKPLYEEKEAVDAQGNPILNEKGQPIMMKKQRIQRPTGQVPFPSDVAQATQLRMNPSGGGGSNVMALAIAEAMKG